VVRTKEITGDGSVGFLEEALWWVAIGPSGKPGSTTPLAVARETREDVGPPRTEREGIELLPDGTILREKDGCRLQVTLP
jgi:hypothetical protein